MIDYIGKKFNRLTVVSETYIQNNRGYNQKYFICKCDCGNIATVCQSKVKRGLTKSCGCLRKEFRVKWVKSHTLDYEISAFNECYSQYQSSAKRRNYSFELTKEEFKHIITQPCIYCGDNLGNMKTNKVGNGNFKYTGIDRYDNEGGYTLENSVPCCSVCNRIKTNMSITELENQLQKIIDNKDMWKRTA